MIGDGLRKRPDSLANDSNIGPMKVINGSSVYFTVNSFLLLLKVEWIVNFFLKRGNHMRIL